MYIVGLCGTGESRCAAQVSPGVRLLASDRRPPHRNQHVLKENCQSRWLKTGNSPSTDVIAFNENTPKGVALRRIFILAMASRGWHQCEKNSQFSTTYE